MEGTQSLFSTNSPRARRMALLALCWGAGIFAGQYISNACCEANAFWMRTSVTESVSIVGLLTVIVFPLMLTAIAVSFSAPLLFLPLAFWKALSFSFCASQIMTAYGGAGFLVRGLLMFSDTWMCLVLLWFWCRNIAGVTASAKKDLALCAGLAAVFGCIDYFWVAPFLKALFP